MKLLKKLLPVMLLALLALNCQKEEADYLEPIQETEGHVQLKALTIDELPDFSGSIAQQTSKVGWASKNDGSDVVLDGSRVLAVTDSVGNTTYSLRMYVADTPHNVFYNVVAKQTYEGVQNEPFVLRYEVDQDYWPEYVAGPRQEKPFKGTIGVYSLEAFGLQMDQNGKMGGEPEPCLSVNAEGGDGDGGYSGGGSNGGNEGSSSSGGGTDYDPGSYYDYWNTYAPDNGGGAGDDTEPFVEVGEGKFGGPGTDGILKAIALTGKSADCPEEETLLPINEEDDFEEKIDDTALKPCLKNVLNDLKTLNKGVGYIVQKFAGNTPGFNWEVKDGSLGGATGTTSTKYNKLTGTVTTTLDSQNWKQATDLSWARTMLHESVHSYIVASFGSNYSGATKTFSDFMKDYSSSTYPDRNDTEHAEFVRNYVSQISSALKDYGIKNGYVLPNQFYEDMAWGGLTHWKKRDSFGNVVKDSFGNIVWEETNWFKKAFPNLSDRTRILNTIQIELTKSDINGNTKVQKGNNAGC
ncbi:hypothetical protein [Flagellimonas crocea]|uniref:hypothetical protein n=1 Tax=Flagellimonas crocea TaxID=3067311 RepID=UPI00296FA3D1|nr:hypothetical protein [Muricauda sp. DH64]